MLNNKVEESTLVVSMLRKEVSSGQIAGQVWVLLNLGKALDAKCLKLHDYESHIHCMVSANSDQEMGACHTSYILAIPILKSFIVHDTRFLGHSIT